VGDLLRAHAGSETPSRTSWSHFFVKDAAKHPLVAAAEGQIEALFGCPALRGPYKPLAKIEAIQGGLRNSNSTLYPWKESWHAAVQHLACLLIGCINYYRVEQKPMA
jgi:hypothetical protein